MEWLYLFASKHFAVVHLYIDNHPPGPARLHKQSASCHGDIHDGESTYQAATYK